MLDRFEAVEQNQYKKIDKDIGDVLHQVYRVKYDGTKKLSKEIFSIMDRDLGTKKTIQQAKTYKKLLAAIQKSKLLQPQETTALFAKANRFLSKDSYAKEKEIIKHEVKQQVIVDGLKSEVEKLDIGSTQVLSDSAPSTSQ